MKTKEEVQMLWDLRNKLRLKVEEEFLDLLQGYRDLWQLEDVQWKLQESIADFSDTLRSEKEVTRKPL